MSNLRATFWDFVDISSETGVFCQEKHLSLKTLNLLSQFVLMIIF